MYLIVDDLINKIGGVIVKKVEYIFSKNKGMLISEFFFDLVWGVVCVEWMMV